MRGACRSGCSIAYKKEGDIVPSKWLRVAPIRSMLSWKNAFETPYVDETKRWVRLFLPGYSSSTLRTNENVTFSEFIVFDIDGGQSLAEVEQRIQDAGLDAVIYTSWNHKALKQGVIAERFRIVVRLKRRFVMVEHNLDGITGQQVWSRAYVLVGQRLRINFDPACADPARLHCMPCHPLEREADYRLILIDGNPLDFDADVDRAKRELVAEREANLTHAAEREQRRSEQTPPNLSVIAAALAHISPCASYPIWRDVTWAVHSEFAKTDAEDDAYDLVDEWSAGCPDKYDPEVLASLWAAAERDRGVTLGTLYHHAIENGYDRDEYLRERLSNLLNKE